MSTTTIFDQTILTAEEANSLHHTDPKRGITWHNVTHALRQQIQADAYEAAKTEIIKERSGKVKAENVFTWRQEKQAQNLARGAVVQQMYKLAEYNGYLNPVHEDEEWGPNAKPQQEAKADHKPNRYGGRCPKCDQWVEAEAGKLVKLPSGKWGAEHLTCPEVSQDVQESSQPVNGLDLTDLPSGYYAVPGGDTRLKLRISHGKEGSKWAGYTFVTDGAEYGQQQRYGMQRPGQAYKGQVEDALKAVVADPKEAMAAYGKLTGTCGKCGRMLEDEQSVARGIGPICAQGW